MKLRMTALFAATVLFASAGPALAGSCGGAAHAHAEEASTQNTIVDIAAGNENFSTLVAAVKAAGLIETLAGKGPFTVFAPTNEAFAALPEGTVENLLKPENRDALIAILTYHVVPGTVTAADVVKLSSAKTVQGDDISITLGKDKVMINNATVLMTDLNASNGVVHVIDQVILPPTTKSE